MTKPKRSKEPQEVGDPSTKALLTKFDRFKIWWKRNHVILVTMRFENNTETTFVQKHSGIDFTYQKGTYVVTQENGVLNTKYKLMHHIYDFGFPISYSPQAQRVIESTDPLEKKKEAKLFIMRPKLLRPFIKFEFARDIAFSKSDFMKAVRIIIAAVIIVAALTLINIYFAYQTHALVTSALKPV